MIYRHTQTGWTTIYWFAVVAVIVLLVFFFVLAPRFHAVGMAVLAFLAVLGFLFSSLTVTVDERRLSWHFGPGFWKKYVSLDEIRSIEPVKTEWWWGYGIRVTPRGWMYNVSGNRAVAVGLASGRRFLLGTDEPEKLAAALSPAIPAISERDR